MGIIIAQIAHVKYYRQLSANLLVHRKHPGVVNSKGLIIRMDFDTMQTVVYNKIHLVHESIHIRVDSTKAVELRAVCTLPDNKLIDMSGTFRFSGNR